MGRINSRAKGAEAERSFIREISEHLGEEIGSKLKRNLEQTRVGGHDIVGLDGFAIEIKRYRVIKEGDIVKFWEQAVEQSKRIDCHPVLAYREDFKSWRVRLPLGYLREDMKSWMGVEWTMEISLEAFAALVRERL